MHDEVARFVQDAGDMDRVLVRPVEDKVSRGEDPTGVLRDSVSTGPQVHAASQPPKFWPFVRACEPRIPSDILERGVQEFLVAVAGCGAEMLLRPLQNVDDVCS